MRQSLQYRLDVEPETDTGLNFDPVRVDPLLSTSYACPDFACALHPASDRPRLSGSKRIRQALLLIFSDPVPTECLRLLLLTDRQWQQALHWLDVSGLALYFLDRIEQLDLTGILPARVLARLRQNLTDNTARTAALMKDWTEIQRSFQSAGLSYATVKGFSLGPPSVPALKLRSQLDLDFLVAETSAPRARRILEDRGFRLRAISGRSWEFSANDSRPMTLRDLYRATPHRYVELHIESASMTSPLLKRLQYRRFCGRAMPVLNPTDLFLGQGLHIYKHLRGQSTRTAHLLEFRRHVIARSGDLAFWRELRVLAEMNPHAPVGLGVVIQIITRMMGDFAPLALTSWTVDRLPSAARLWIDMYGHDSILADSPGTKLHLFLEEALAPTGMAAKRSLRQTLVPPPTPPTIVHVASDEDLLARVRRHWAQLKFTSLRARFHFREGLRYLRESRRWRKSLARTAG
jgi:Uncharacterised nucleotidyltransferase